jgi:hypothetical protein
MARKAVFAYSKPADYIFRFAELIARSLDDAETSFQSDEWRKIPPEELESEIYSQFERFWVDFSRDGLPMPWHKIAGLALIGWVRTNYPKTFAAELRNAHPD